MTFFSKLQSLFSPVIRSLLFQEEKKFHNISTLLALLKQKDWMPEFHTIATAGTEPETIIEGKRVLMFASNNYLGLSTRPEVIEAASKALRVHGIGPGGSRFLCGNIALLEQLDRVTADLVGMEDAITFPAGYMANTAIFKALLDPFIGPFPHKKGAAEIYSDEYNHGTIVEGCRISYANKVSFMHNDMSDLQRKISSSSAYPKMIVTEGVFTPEGHFGKVQEIASIAEQHRAILMIDDAHGIGVIGKNGEGTVAHLGLCDKVDIVMGSYDKALGGMGGFLAGKKEVIEYLRVVARPYVFSSAVSGVVAGGVIEAIRICKQEPELRERLFQNSSYIRKELHNAGFTILGTPNVPVVCLLIGDETRAVQFSRMLLKQNIYCPSFRWPAVPKGKSRLRITLMATHTKAHLDQLLESLITIGKQEKLIV
ncbi:MAG: aminotransferase class I/II-fold pyridoxal phosphate-dependent enzyme [Candidatus Yanofskybacteria bacterium]|nr:aminotransferase class I/II-fold pyridoxal phosphate-dependent enzyme [Candidatus Yanofskybacteria bacterium]